MFKSEHNQNNNNTDKKKICFIMPNLAGGGAERVVSILTSQFAEMGIDTSVYLVKQNIIEYTINPLVKIDTSFCGGKKNPLKQISDIRRIIKENTGAVFISFLPYQNIYLSIANLFLHNRIVLSLRNDPKRLENGSKLVQYATKIAFHLAYCIVFQTKDAQNLYSNSIRKKSAVILNPLIDDLPAYDIKETKKKIISFCRLQSQKNLQMAIRAFKRFHDLNPDYTYHIFGKGPEKDDLLSLIEELELDEAVFIEDFKTDILEEAKDYRAFMLTSDYEGLSNSMIEAMAMGLPVICTDCPIGGARMVIEDEKNGYLVPVGDEDALVRKMGKLTDIEKCISVSNEAKKLAKQLKADFIAKQWLGVIFPE